MRSPHGPTALLPRCDHSQEVLLSCMYMLAVTPASWAWSTSTWLLWFAQTARHSLYYILALRSLHILCAKKTLSLSRPGLSQPAQPATPWPKVHRRLAKPSPTSSPLSHLHCTRNRRSSIESGAKLDESLSARPTFFCQKFNLQLLRHAFCKYKYLYCWLLLQVILALVTNGRQANYLGHNIQRTVRNWPSLAEDGDPLGAVRSRPPRSNPVDTHGACVRLLSSSCRSSQQGLA